MYILASASPRRKELITRITEDFLIDTPKGEEFCPDDISAEARPEFLACQKAEEVSARHKGEIIIAADTAVFLDGDMLGKPKDEADARRMLKTLSGRTHHVITGCCIKRDEKIKSFSVKTAVTFYELTDEQIDAYIKTKEPFDKDHPFSAILGLPNVCLTPHMAWGSYESRNRCIRRIAENVTEFLKGNIHNRIC